MDLLDRIAAALKAAAPTTELTALLIEAGGEQCWQRGRLIHRLSAILYASRPPMATSTTHRFKADFAARIIGHQASAPIIEVNGVSKSVTPESLTDEDVPLLKQYGYGHLIEALPAPAKKAKADEPAEEAAPKKKH